MKLRVLAATVAALTLTAGIATAQTKSAPAKAATPAAKPVAGAAEMPVVDKTHASYAFGWQLGQELANTDALREKVVATIERKIQGQLTALMKKRGSE